MGNDLEQLLGMLPYLIPLIIVELALLVFALVDLFRREGMKDSTRVIWALVIVLINIIGPIIYFIFGRREDNFDGRQD